MVTVEIMVKIIKTDRQRGISNIKNNMPVGGENTRDSSSIIDGRYAKKIQNYIIRGENILETRKGQKKLSFLESTMPQNLYNFADNLLVWTAKEEGDSTPGRIGTYDIITNTKTPIRGFNGEDVAGVAYGKFFYCGTKKDKVKCFYANGLFLNYKFGNDGINGETITGVDSGSTAVLRFSTGTGATGTYVIDEITGIFQNGEKLDGSESGSAFSEVDGVAYDNFELVNSPKADVLTIYNSHVGAYLVAGDLSSNESTVQWSDADTDNLTIPFINWSTTQPPDPTDGGITNFRAGGKLNALVSHQKHLACFYEDGTVVFRLENMEQSVGLVQNTVVVSQEFNFGGNKGAISTPFGIIYTNEKGIWIMNMSGDRKSDTQISEILGENRIDILGLDNPKIEYDGENKLYISCGENSDINNIVLVYDLEKQAWTRFTGWYLNGIVRKKGKLYGLDARDVTIFELLSGNSDNGNDIEYAVDFKEDDFGLTNTLKEVRRTYFKASVSPDTCISVSYDIWDRTYEKQLNYVTAYLGGEGISVDFWGIGKQAISKLKDEEEVDFNNPDNLTEVLKDITMSARSFLKLKIKIRSTDRVPHKIHFVQLELRKMIENRQNNLSKVSC